MRRFPLCSHRFRSRGGGTGLRFGLSTCRSGSLCRWRLLSQICNARNGVWSIPGAWVVHRSFGVHPSEAHQREEGRCFIPIKWNHDVDSIAPYRRSCSFGSRRQSVRALGFSEWSPAEFRGSVVNP
ncbi:hypothetical protein Bca4012_065354 [Brassica carinata]